jgi:hypothetical protein
MQVRARINFMAKDLIKQLFPAGFSGIGVEKAPLWVR